MTISATGKSRCGFTILEVLLVLVIAVAITGLFVANIDSLFRERDEVSVEAAFWETSREARLHAQLTRRPVTVRYDSEEGGFVMESRGEVVRSFPASAETYDGAPIAVEFVQERPRTELVLVRGQLIDTRPIEQVVYYPDGTCTQFWVEFAVGNDRRQIRIDPWTGAQMLVAKE